MFSHFKQELECATQDEAAANDQLNYSATNAYEQEANATYDTLHAKGYICHQSLPLFPLISPINTPFQLTLRMMAAKKRKSGDL